MRFPLLSEISVLRLTALMWSLLLGSQCLIRGEADQIFYEVLCLSICPVNPVLNTCGSQGINMETRDTDF